MWCGSVHRAKRVLLQTELLEARDVPAAIPIIALGTEAGVDPRIRVLNQSTNEVLFEKFVFVPQFRGGTRVAIGDINGDKQDDVIVGNGAGLASQICAFDGATGTEIARFNVPASASFRGGVTVAAGDVDGDGIDEIITGLDSTSTPTVSIFKANGTLVKSFLAYAATARQGVRVATGDVNGDGIDEIITGAGFGAGPNVKVFNAAGTQQLSFNAFAATFRGGVNVAAGDLDGDGRDELIIGAGYNGGGKVSIVDGTTGTAIRSFTSGGAGGRGGIRVASGLLNDDGTMDIFTGSGNTTGWRAFDHLGTPSRTEWAPGYMTGVYIAVSPQDEVRNRKSVDFLREWNQAALTAIKNTNTPPPVASRALAMTQIAVFDALNAYVKAGNNLIATGTPPANASLKAAAIMAACNTLDALFPTQQSLFHALANTQFATIPDGTAKTTGTAWGLNVSNQVIAARANDHSADAASYTPGMNPGDWQPTPPANAAALLPGWGNVTPFGMTASELNAYIAAPPPALTSFTYASDYNITKDYGAINSTYRNADQTEIALFWADGSGTYTPPGHWNVIAANLSREDGLNLYQTARMFAQLDIGLADAAIICWKTKYQYNYWRPVTAIRAGDTDNNPYTLADATWTPLITTPPFPEYTSGHSTFSGTASTILAEIFGESRAFSSTNFDGTVTRNYSNFRQAADEAGMSRIYGGIHFMSANLNGLQAGRQLGEYVFNHVT